MVVSVPASCSSVLIKALKQRAEEKGAFQSDAQSYRRLCNAWIYLSERFKGRLLTRQLLC